MMENEHDKDPSTLPAFLLKNRNPVDDKHDVPDAFPFPYGVLRKNPDDMKKHEDAQKDGKSN